jgi:hypothetical protein
MYPSGSAIGSAQDAIKFLSALMPSAHEGEASVLFQSNSTLNEMLQTSLSFRDGFPRFSHGFMHHYGAVRVLGHGGNTVAFSTLFTIAPEERFGLVVMTNQAGETALCSGLTKALFGEFVPPETTAEVANASELSGIFTLARRQKSGFAGLLMSLTIFPVRAIDENTLNIAGSVFTQVYPYVFRNTGGFYFLDIFDFIFFETESGPDLSPAVTRVSVNYFDFLPISIGSLIINFGSAVLFLLCILYIFVAFIISIIGAVRNRKKNIPSGLVKKLNIVLYASMAAAVVNNVILALRALNFSAYSSLRLHLIFNIAFIIFVPICVGFMWLNRKQTTTKASAVFNMFTMISSLVYAVLLIVWEFWH